MHDSGSPRECEFVNDAVPPRVAGGLPHAACGNPGVKIRLDRPLTATTVTAERGTLRPPIGLTAASVCGMVAAVLYTMANVALRQCVGVDPFLVSAMKAAPTVVILGPFLVWMMLTRQTIATSLKMAPRFVVASFFGQVIGNGAFQVALGVIGLAASVPITLGVLIIGSAVLGRILLGEPVSPRKIVAMMTLIGAVVILSLPGATALKIESATPMPVWVGALCAAASGFAYAFFGVAMRQALTGGMSAPATMLISGVVGTIALWSITLFRVGTGPLAELAGEQWAVMIAAGVFNFTAFAALSLSLKALPVVAVNLINASQVAMAAVAGVVLFAEPVTAPLAIGTALTFAGLMILASRRNAAKRPLLSG